MRLFLMGLLAIAIIGGGGAGAYFYFKNPALASVGPDGEPVMAAKAKPDKNAEPKYVHLDPLTLPVIDDNGVSSNVSIVVDLEVMDQKNVEPIRKQLPRLIDAYIQDMYGVLNKRAALKGGVVQVGMVKERLNAITKRVLGDNMVEDVLLQVVSQRAM